MRFLTMHKMTEALEKGGPPDPEIMAGIDQLIADGLSQQIFVSGDGLRPTAHRLRLVYQDGQRTITPGPFADGKELLGGFTTLRVASQEEAIAWCDKVAAARGDGQFYLGPVVEAWDLGLMPKPDDAQPRYMITHRIDARTEAELPIEPERQAKLLALEGEMRAAGVLDGAGEAASTRRGARIRYKGGKRTVLDGPFTESKELIAGYAILELPSKEAALEWSARFGDIVLVDEVEVRELLPSA